MKQQADKIDQIINFVLPPAKAAHGISHHKESLVTKKMVVTKLLALVSNQQNRYQL